MEKILVKGDVYTVATQTECKVTSANGTPLGTATAEAPYTFTATTDRVVLSDPDAEFARVNPKYAPVKLRLLGLLGGGVSSAALPNGYLEAEFLESTGGPYIDTRYIPNNETGAQVVLETRRTTYLDAMVLACMADSGQNYFCIPRPQPSVGFAWGRFTRLINDTTTYLPGINVSELNFRNSRKAKISNLEAELASSLPQTSKSLFLFNCNGYDVGWVGRIFAARITQHDDIAKDFSPALDPQGVPCFFEKVTKQPLYNSGSGQFVVGVNLKQSLKLRKLPAGGGSLTVSLPGEANLSVTGVPDALQAAADKGWTVTVQYRETEVSADLYDKYEACVTVDDVKDVNASYKSDLTSDYAWVYSLPNLEDSSNLFGGYMTTNKISKWLAPLPKLRKSYRMFWCCAKLKVFTSELPNLEQAQDMFMMSLLTEWKRDLPKLQNALGMFSTCPQFKEFDAYCPELISIDRMFYTEDVNIGRSTSRLYMVILLI